MPGRAATPLRLQVADLLRQPGTRRELEVSAPLDELEVSSSRVAAGADVRLALRLQSVPDGIVLTGTAEAPWTGQCRRCLRPVAGTLQAELQEIFESSPVEGETWPLEGDQIDVEPAARESVVLELPLVPLCQDDCQGLCAECGADRNEVDCGHTIDTTDPRWAELDALRFDN
jgi:uncharacterized protein